MELKCLILNITPFGPRDDNGIGKNCFIQYIPLDNNSIKNTDRSKGYYIGFNQVKNKTELSLFQDFDLKNILKPCTIVLDGTNIRYANVKEIKF